MDRPRLAPPKREDAKAKHASATTRQEDGMALIITGIFIQFLGLAVQFIQLRQGRQDNPEAQAPVPDAGRTAPGQGRRGEAAAADRDEANEHARQAATKTPSPGHGGTAQARLELKGQDPADD
jgi:hypothetical protein